MRRALLGLFLLGVVFTGVELLLLEHTETLWQSAPLGLLALALVALGGWLAVPGLLTLRAFQGLMLAHVLCGAVGLYLHYQGNVEFELEMYPSLEGFELFREATMGATPVLAPAMMAQLGLLGLLYVYRYPLGRPSQGTPSQP